MSRWSPSRKAQADLVEIWDYTAKQWSVTQADDYIRRIERALSEAVSGSPLAQQMDDVRQGYWRIKSGRHMCYFVRRSDGIRVIRILHERMDVDGHL